MLFLLFVDGVLFCNRVEFLEFKFFVRMLALVLARVNGMTLANALAVTNRDELNEFIL